MLRNLTRRQKNAIAFAVVAGGASGVHVIRKTLQDALREQSHICSSADILEGSGSGARRRRSPKVAVDGVFAKRLYKILKICIPNPASPEAGLIYFQTLCLVARTFLTDVASQIEGGVGRYVQTPTDRVRLQCDLKPCLFLQIYHCQRF